MSDPDIQRAEDIYRLRLRPMLEPAEKGKYVAIDVLSGDFFVGEEMLQAYRKAAEAYPDRTFVFKHIGYPAARFIGSR